MNMAKSANVIASIVLCVCGVVACLFPAMVGDYYGMAFLEPDAKTTVRVLGGFCCGIAYLLAHFAYRLHDQKPLLFCVAVILLSFALPRFLGLVIDGVDQPKMIYELVFEVVSLMIVVRLYVKN
jgi:hypothetical protein